MVDFSEETVKWNIDTTKHYLEKAKKVDQFLEMEIGITGGEEDGVNNEKVKRESMYTESSVVHNIYKDLSSVSPYFTIAAGFGNVHGVYKPGNVELRPALLKQHQEYVKKEENTEDNKPVFLVFHGGSGSALEEFQAAISYGVVKVVCHTSKRKRKNRVGLTSAEPRYRSPMGIPRGHS